MAKNPKRPAPFPSKQEILKFIEGHGGEPRASDIARAFHIRGDDKKKLGNILRELRHSSGGGRPEKRRDHPRGGKRDSHDEERYRNGKAAQLPGTATIEIIGTNEDGDLIAKPSPWEGRKEPPFILVQDDKAFQAKIGDFVLARLTRWDRHSYGARILKMLPKPHAQKIVGVFRKHGNMATIEPVNRKDKWEFEVPPDHWEDARQGDLVEAEALSGGRSFGRGMPPAKITKTIGPLDSPKSSSLVAIARHAIPTAFSSAAISQAMASVEEKIEPGDRVDLRSIPLVTIDGEDARDFDDAVWAEADTDPKNKGGWHILVAIADVAHYVHPFDALDHDAFQRGNSVYFPDRVVPMLSEELSNGVCSLKPNEDRYCLAVHIWIDAQGNARRYQFLRGIMRSHARLIYEKAQAAYDAKDTNLYPILEPLYGAYKALSAHREERGSLELDLPEYAIKINPEGVITSVGKRERMDSHKLVEEFMIAANVAAADAILQKALPGVYRVHETPPADRVEELRDFLKQIGFALSKGDGIRAQHFNKVLEKTTGTPHAALVHTAILRTQTQAYYSPKNLGHFGLALTHYAHFTSPIRRYSDLLVHRALITLLFPKEARKDGISKGQAAQLEDITQHISATERRAMLAERDANERYMVHYMANHIGWTGEGVVSGINQFGLFVTLPETGATGFIPISTVMSDFFRYMEKEKSFIGTRTRKRLQLGQMLTVRLREANTVTGSLRFELLQDGAKVSAYEADAGKAPQPQGHPAGREHRRYEGKRHYSNDRGERERGKHKKHTHKGEGQRNARAEFDREQQERPENAGRPHKEKGRFKKHKKDHKKSRRHD